MDKSTLHRPAVPFEYDGGFKIEDAVHKSHGVQVQQRIQKMPNLDESADAQSPNRSEVDAYDVLASVYDHFQIEIDPQAWAHAIDAWYQASQMPHAPQGDGGRPLVLDLGCGTGRFARAFADLGYDVIGVDGSAQMLEQCAARFSDSDVMPILLQQDIRSFELYGTVDLIICLLDTMNHVTNPLELLQVFKLCANYLHPGGVMVFDIATLDHFKMTLGDDVFFFMNEDQALWWQNHYDDQAELNIAEMTLFDAVEVELESDSAFDFNIEAEGESYSESSLLDQSEDLARRELVTGCATERLYRKLETTIFERYYAYEQIRLWLMEAGFEAVTFYPDLSPSERGDERIFVVARSAKTVIDKGISESANVYQNEY